MFAENFAQAPSSPENSEPQRVLIVEDNLMNRRLAVFLVKSKGIEAESCASGAEALIALSQKKYQMVLMDIEMPGMNGCECTRKIRNELRLHIPVIAMTAHDSEEERRKCDECGMAGYITKPMDEEEFSGLLRKYKIA